MSVFDIDFRKLPILKGIFKWIGTFGFDIGVPVTVIAVAVLLYAFSLSSSLASSAFSFFFNLAPIWLPIILFLIFFHRWMNYVHTKYWVVNGRVTFRIIPPQDIKKSPEAMEFVLNQIWNKHSIDNLWQAYIDGKGPIPVSLEIVSIGGDVRFYVNLPAKKVKDIFVSAMYSQYPGVELVEEPVDYLGEIVHGSSEWQTMTLHLNKKAKDWAPIKTYIDYALDKMPDEDEKVDPITPLLETMSGIGPNERIYIQFLITSAIEYKFSNGALFWPSPPWTKEVAKYVNLLLKRDDTGKSLVENQPPQVSEGEKEIAKAIERNMGKYAFSTGIRFLYACKPGHFRSDIVGAVNRGLAQYDIIGRQEIGVRWRTDFDYNWFSDPTGKKKKILKDRELLELKMRSLAPKSSIDGGVIFTTEELATMFHLPGLVALTPSLGRIPSTRSQAPSNLPVGDNLPV